MSRPGQSQLYPMDDFVEGDLQLIMDRQEDTQRITLTLWVKDFGLKTCLNCTVNGRVLGQGGTSYFRALHEVLMSQVNYYFAARQSAQINAFMLREIQRMIDRQLSCESVRDSARRPSTSTDETLTEETNRQERFSELRDQGLTLGQINEVLEREGYRESFGAGLLPCPTKHHRIIRDANSVRRMINRGE